MKKLYNVIFPIWFILIMPPIVLLVIPSNFVIDSIVLILSFKLLKMNSWFNKYKNSILKVWIIGFIVDIFGSLLLLATQFISNNDYLYQNLTYPLAWNPFSSAIAFIYVLIVILICGILIYFINYKFSFNKAEIDNKNKKIVCLMLGLITAPYLFLFPTSYLYKDNNNTLEKYMDSYIGDNSAVGNILNRIYSGKYYEDFTLKTNMEPYGITINYKNKEYGDIYKNLEEDALIIFKLVKNVGFVEFNLGTKNYIFDKDYINNICDIEKVSINDIYDRYKMEYFDKFSYLGHIKSYDIFDTSSSCGIEKSKIYSDNDYNYFIECSSVDTLYLVGDDTKIKLITGLSNNKISVDDLFKTNLKISKEKRK